LGTSREERVRRRTHAMTLAFREQQEECRGGRREKEVQE
jgi:hypothetical protein